MKTFKPGQAVTAEGYAYAVIEFISAENAYLLQEVGTKDLYKLTADGTVDIKSAP